MSKKRKDEKIAVVIDGMDICRIVPFKPIDGKYEIKMDFLGNDFDTSCYRLFSHRPIQWEIYDSNQLEVTYHKGENAKPLTIHLKQKVKKEGEDTYTNLPLKRIQAPNVNQLFPIPIVKLEIPSKVIVRPYKPKGYHRLIDPRDCNVVEIYLSHADFDMNAFMEKLPGMHLSFMMLSFEIFATNTVITDYQKGANVIPHGESKSIMTEFQIFNDMKIIAIHFKDERLNERLSRINVTFIENELSEAILTMMKVVYSKTTNNGLHDNVYLGGATLKDVNQPTIPMARPSIGTNNVISDSFERNKLTKVEKEKLYWHALKLRIQLRDALLEHQKNSDELKRMLQNKVDRFVKALNIIKEDINKLQLKEDEYEWFSSYPKGRSVDVSLMVAKYLDMNQCLFYGRFIGRPSAEPEVFHAWLQYYDLFDIDVTYSSLSEFTNLDLEEIVVVPAEQHPILAEYAGLRNTIQEIGYERGPLKCGTYQADKFNNCFERNNKLLWRIYTKILQLILDTA